MSPELIPLHPPYSPQVKEVLDQYPQQDGYLLKLFRVFANSLRFLTKGGPNLLDKDSPLSLTDREIVILRVTANNYCEYEWGVHVSVFAKAAGLSASQVKASTLANSNQTCWNDGQKNLLQVVDQLTQNGQLNDTTLNAFRQRWSKEQQLEICALCGAYQTVSYVANISNLDKEDFAARFPVADSSL